MSAFISYDTVARIANQALVRKNFTHHSRRPPWKYIRYRLMRPLLKLHFKGYRWLHRPSPWLAPTAIHILNTVLTREHRMLEYGSGLSSVFFAGKVGELTSIEHHEGWFLKVQRLLTDRRIQNVNLLFIPQNSEGEAGAPSFQKTNALEGFRYRKEYYHYFEKVTEFPNGYFDVVLIDGRARVECALNVLPKIRKPGMLILDNSERERYLPIHRALEEYPKVTTTTGLTDTTFWFIGKDDAG